MKALKKIDRFYLVLAGVLLLLSAPLIYTGLGIFSALITAGELNTSLTGQARVDKQRLKRAITMTYDKEIPTLNVRETFLTLQVEEETPDEN